MEKFSFKKTSCFLLPLLIITFSTLSLNRNTLWSKPITLLIDGSIKSPKDIRVIYNLANRYFDLQKYEPAKHIFERVLTIDPWHKETLSNLGTIYEKNGDISKSLEYFKKAGLSDPDDEQIRFNIGTAYGKLGNIKEAKKELLKSIELNPKYAKSYSNLGTAYFFEEDYVKAIETLQKAVSLDPSDSKAYFQLAQSLHFEKRFSEAINMYNKTIELVSADSSLVTTSSMLIKLAKENRLPNE